MTKATAPTVANVQTFAGKSQKAGPARREIPMSKVAPAAGSGTQTASTYAVVPRAVLDDLSLSDAAVRLFAVLDARVTTKASQQIRQDTLAEQLGWSVRKVQRALGDLVAAGHVSVKHTARSSRVSVTNGARVKKDRAAAGSGTRGTAARMGTGARSGHSGHSGDTTNLSQHTPSDDKSVAGDTTNLTDLYRSTSLRNTDTTAQPRALTRAGVPIITEPEREPREPKTQNMPADDGPDIMPDRVLVDYLTEIWKVTGHHLDRNHLTEGVLTRIHQHGTSAQETARVAAAQLAAQGTKVRNPAGFLVKVVLPGIADQTLTAPPAPKPTPTPKPLSEITSAARCEHGAEIGRCALCRQDKPAQAKRCIHSRPKGDCLPCRLRDEHYRRIAAVGPEQAEIVIDHGCGHQERKPDGSCNRCRLEIAAAKLAMAASA